MPGCLNGWNVRARWISLFSHPELIVQDLEEQSFVSPGLGHPEDDLGGVTLRSVYWRVHLKTLPLDALLAAASVSSTSAIDRLSNARQRPKEDLNTVLKNQRDDYDRVRGKWLKAPDGRWASDCSAPQQDGSKTLPSEEKPGSSLEKDAASSSWDPLNTMEENPWKSWFANAELRKTIDKDVERTYPDIEYFQDEGVRKTMLTILFLWAMENEDVGYRQVSRPPDV